MTDIVDTPADATPDEMLPDAVDAAEAPAAEAPVVVAPDRADSPVSEVTERFLRAVVAQVPLELIEELHLFSPLRQGTVETGIAVLAARVPAPVVVEPEPSLDFSSAADGDVPAEGEEELLTTDDAETSDTATEGMGDDVAGEEVVAEAVVMDEVVAEEIVAEEAGDDEVTADEAVDLVHDESVLVDESSDDEDVAVIAESVAPAVVRHTVYTARYRYVIKGPERGKWEASVKAEADAPLITVETVVRGVQRRAGEESEIVRFTQAQIAKAVRVRTA